MGSPKRILVTGASGFVGRALTPALVAAFPQATIRATGATLPILGLDPCVETVAAPLEDEAGLRAALHPAPDLIIHLAARASVAASAHAAYDTMAVNLGGTMRLAEAVRQHAPGAAFIFASTAEVYGATFLNGPARESDPAQPRSPYARSKAACELALTDMLGDQHAVTILRLFNHTGPGQDERFVVPGFAAQIARAERGAGPAEIQVGNLSAARDFLDIRDVVAAYILVAQETGQARPGMETFNVCSGGATPVQQVLDGLVSQARIPLRITEDPSRLRPSDIPLAQGDPSRFNERFDWRRRYTLPDTLTTVLHYWRAQ
jgi:GDP-4-dehydro-6-deoxy-D-mannose reductase